jgi:glycosyltransferase involved in cell wall biosynthesis
MEVPFLSLVIPTYNESARIGDTLTRCSAFLQSWAPSWEMVIADDGSSDDTVRIARDWAVADRRIRVIERHHQGKGAAVRAGMLAARGQWRVFADADLSMDITELPLFLTEPADVAIASREAAGARRIGEPAWRHASGRAFNWCVRMFAVRGIQDTQCGYKMFRGDVAEWLFAVSQVSGFAFDVELLFLAQRAGLTVREVPIVWHHRAASSMRLSTGCAAFLQILTVRWNALLGRYRQAPPSLRTQAAASHEPTAPRLPKTL